MFGRFVLSLFVFVFIIGIEAQSQSPGNQEGIIISDEAYIFVEASFDAKVLAVRPQGEKLKMSNRKKNGFFRVKLFNGQLGWASEADVQATQKISQEEVKNLEQANQNPFPKKGEVIQGPPAHTRKTFAQSRYRGIFFQNQKFREKTLGKTRQDELSFVGINLTGFDTLVDGPFYLDTRMMATSTPPDYYEKLTGQSASGFALRVQSSFVSVNPFGGSVLFHYGLGVSATLSQFQVSFLENGIKKKYSLDDLNVGLVIPIGLSFKLGPTNTQVFYHYYHEKITSSGLSLGIAFFY